MSINANAKNVSNYCSERRVAANPWALYTDVAARNAYIHLLLIYERPLAARGAMNGMSRRHRLVFTYSHALA